MTPDRASEFSCASFVDEIDVDEDPYPDVEPPVESFSAGAIPIRRRTTGKQPPSARNGFVADQRKA
eukprot:9875882-Karenia_brevis.AAC.1